MTTRKFLLISLLTALVLAAPMLRLFYFPDWSRGSHIDYLIASFFGLMLSLPLSFGFYSVFCFPRFKERLMFMIVPTFIFALFLQIGDGLRDFIIIFPIGFIIGLLGMGIGFLVKFFYKKYKA